MADSPHVFLMEDDPALRLALRDYLTIMGFRVTTAPDAESEVPVDIVISDYRIPGGRTGADVIAEQRARAGRDIPAILLTGDVSGEAAQAVEGHSRTKMLLKPVRMDVLVNEICALLNAAA